MYQRIKNWFNNNFVKKEEFDKLLLLNKKLYSDLIKTIDELNKLDVLKEENRLNRDLLNTYPSQKISWNARSFPFSNIKCKVPVQVLVTPNDPYIRQDLIDWGLYETEEKYETLIPKIYKKIHSKYYKYKTDKEAWGVPEVWEFPFELREKGFIAGFDCDSWSHFIVSYYRAVGVPAGKVWCVAGETSITGHNTVYIWSDVDKKFHHTNSTYGGILHNEINKYPTHDDAENGTDKIGINSVWCSYNDICARSTFSDKIIGNLLIGGSENGKNIK